VHTYICLLRGINVSGQKKIKMVDLKVSLEKLNFKEIATYIQSGNIVFKSEIDSTTELEKHIHDIILKDFGFDVPTLVKTSKEVRDAFEQNPFEKDATKDPKLFYVVFLKNKPASENIAHLKTYDYSPEVYVLKDKIIYFYAANGAGKAKMSNNFFENKLKTQATTRNWRTTHKLVELSH